jgi:integrase
MRPGELFALEWRDIDFTKNRILVSRNIYKGKVQNSIKTSASKTIALPPPVTEILVSQPTRTGALVFRSKTGKRLAQPTLSHYWAQVKASAGLEFDFYMATKHYGVHLLYMLGLSKRAICAQMGWSETVVDKLLVVYGHIDQIGLAEIDALYETGNVPLPQFKAA